MVYTTKLMLKTANEIYEELKTSGQLTAEANIVKKIKTLIEEDRKRILESAKPITFDKLPWRLRLFFTWEILRRPNEFLVTFINSTYFMFLACVNDEECDLIVKNDND